MGDMLIRGIPAALKDRIQKAASQEGKSLSDKAIDLLRKGVAAEAPTADAPKQSAWEAIRSVFEAEGAVTDEFYEVMQEIEAERKRGFGRPVDFGDEPDADK
jgi:plasmid stability protein